MSLEETGKGWAVKQRAWMAMLLAVLWLVLNVSLAAAQGLTPRQVAVVSAICAACERYAVDCTLPLAVARRESGYGVAVVSQVDRAADGSALSVGVYQWHRAGLGGYRGPGFEDDWRWDLARDVDRGVQLLTSHLRGGVDWRRHWWTPAGLDTNGLPVCGGPGVGPSHVEMTQHAPPLEEERSRER